MEVIIDKYYVYLHRRLTDNKVFYVGKGCNNRAYSTSGRNERWSRTYKKHGRLVEIVFDNLTNDEAFQCEVDTILEMHYFCQPLCNMTMGGDGATGMAEDSRLKISEANSDKTVYTFTSENGVYFTGTRHEASRFYNITKQVIQPMVTRKIKNNGIGIVQDGESIQQAINRLFPNVKGINSPCSVKEILRLVNKEFHVLEGIRTEIAAKMNWNLSSFGGFLTSKPTAKTFHGYVVVKHGESDCDALKRGLKKLSFDNNKYCFLNIKTLELFNCTRNELKKETGVDVGDLFHLGRRVVLDYALIFTNETIQDTLKRVNANLGRKDLNIYCFRNIKTNEVFNGTRCALAEHTNTNVGKYRALFYSKPYKFAAGWELLKE